MCCDKWTGSTIFYLNNLKVKIIVRMDVYVYYTSHVLDKSQTYNGINKIPININLYILKY